MQIHALLYLKLLVPAALRDCEINILRLKEFFMQNISVCKFTLHISKMQRRIIGFVTFNGDCSMFSHIYISSSLAHCSYEFVRATQ